MAKIPDGSFKNWQDNETIHASDYVQEREMLRAAANDNADRLSSLETVTTGLQLDTVQLQKITNDSGAPKISVSSSTQSILSELLKLGTGMHTFYAATGSQDLPPTNVSIRGMAHFTSANFGWVYATDYKNNIFTNYYDSNKWLGWKQLLSSGTGVVVNYLNTIIVPGTYWVNANTVNAPTTRQGILKVDNTDPDSLYLVQTYIDVEWGDYYERTRYSGVWQPWKKRVHAEDEQEGLWLDGVNDGWYMFSNQTVTPTKKLSQCRNGWILVWSDYDATAPAQTNNYDFHYSYIPKGTLFKGSSHLFAIPSGLTSSNYYMVVKRLYVYDNKLVGHDDNSKSDNGANDVVLRMVLEW